MAIDIRAIRLTNQGLASRRFGSPHDVLHALGPIQAQDYSASLWALGVRLGEATEGAIEQAVAARTIVRTWPLRCTLHFVAAEDARWILQHLAPRVISSIRGRYRRLELRDADFSRAADVVARALEGGRCLPRPVLYGILEGAGLSTAGQRGIHLLQRLALERLICSGPRQGKQHTFMLMDEWLPPAPEIERDEALARLACLYFGSRGPATVRDFAWWSGLSLSDARLAINLGRDSLTAVTIDGREHLLGAGADLAPGGDETCHLLPAFDEYVVAYTDRAAVLDPAHSRRVNSGGGLLAPTILLGGRVAGTWKRVIDGRGVEVTALPFESLAPAERELVALAGERYAAFLGLPLRLSVGES